MVRLIRCFAATVLIAAAAQAHGLNRQSAAEPTQLQRIPAMTQQHMSRSQIIQLQRELKSAGLYRGKVNGIMNKNTRLAMARSQGRTGFGQTAMLNRPARHRLAQPETTNVGSSTPTTMGQQNNLNTTQAPNAGSPNGAQQKY